LREGSIYPVSSPDSPPLASTNVLNLWQLNQIALVVERWWGAVKLRSSAVYRAAVRPSSRQERPLRCRKLAAVVAARKQVAVGVRGHLASRATFITAQA
jgi:hypothetical protein